MIIVKKIIRVSSHRHNWQAYKSRTRLEMELGEGVPNMSKCRTLGWISQSHIKEAEAFITDMQGKLVHVTTGVKRHYL